MRTGYISEQQPVTAKVEGVPSRHAGITLVPEEDLATRFMERAKAETLLDNAKHYFQASAQMKIIELSGLFLVCVDEP